MLCLLHDAALTIPRSIIAVHGLNGHRDKTWTAANGRHWLRDLLPNDIPNARVFCWGYDANTHGGRVSCQYLYDHAKSLVSDLCLERRLTNVGSGTERKTWVVKVNSTRRRRDRFSSLRIVSGVLLSRALASLRCLLFAADHSRPLSTQTQRGRERWKSTGRSRPQRMESYSWARRTKAAVEYCSEGCWSM